MKQEYTRGELSALMGSLRQVFPAARVVDAASGAVLDDAAQQPTGAYCHVPALDENGVGWQMPAAGQQALTMFRTVAVEGRACLLAVDCSLPDDLPAERREADAMRRRFANYQDERNRDYMTGAYNRRYLADVWQPAMVGHAPCAVLARVKEYGAVCAEYGREAGDNCLNAAAGILQRAVGADPAKAVLVRLEDGVFLLSADTPAAELTARLREALDASRRVFSISLSRRAEFSLAIAAADWAEAGSWDLMLALAEQRLAYA